MMLGATCYAISGTLRVTDPLNPNGPKVPKYNMSQLTPNSGSQCYHATKDTVGAFALLIRRDTIPGLLRYFEHTYQPFDHIFGVLNEKAGYSVPVVYPSLFAPQLAHESTSQPGKKFDFYTVKTRMLFHRWKKTDYCGWDREFSRDTDWRHPETRNPFLKHSGVTVRPAFDERTARMQLMVKRLRAGDETTAASLPTVILSVQRDGLPAANLKLLLEGHGMDNVQVWQGVDWERIWGGPEDIEWDAASDLEPREMGVLYSMREILKGAWFGDLEHVLVLQEDVVPHCRLASWLRMVLNNTGCMASMAPSEDPNVTPATETGGGAILLGALEDTNLSDEPPQIWHEGQPLTCYETTPGTYGAYAVLYSRRNIPYTLRWMEEIQLPYGAQWADLRRPKKKPGRFKILAQVVTPNLFAPAPGSPVLSRRSTYKQPHWDTSHYCFD